MNTATIPRQAHRTVPRTPDRIGDRRCDASSASSPSHRATETSPTCSSDFPLGTIWFAVLISGLSVGVSMLVVALLGIPMLWAMWYVVRWFANVERITANALLGQHLALAPMRHARSRQRVGPAPGDDQRSESLARARLPDAAIPRRDRDVHRRRDGSRRRLSWSPTRRSPPGTAAATHSVTGARARGWKTSPRTRHGRGSWSRSGWPCSSVHFI